LVAALVRTPPGADIHPTSRDPRALLEMPAMKASVRSFRTHFSTSAVASRFVGLILTLILSSSPALAVDYYVRRNAGLDTNDGRSPATAFQTIARAMTAAQAGDAIYIGAGTFTEALVTQRAGTATAPIRLVGDHTGTRTGDRGTPIITSTLASALTVNHANFQVDRATFSGGTRTVVWNAASGALTNCSVLSATTDNIRVTAGSLIINSCTISTGSGNGLVVVGGSATIQSSQIHSLSGAAIILDGTNTNLNVLNNTIRGMTGPTIISILRGSATIANNLIRSSSGTGVDIAQPNNGGGASAAIAEVWHNTFHGLAGPGLRLTSGTATVRNNITTSGPLGLAYVAGSLTHSNNLYFSLTQNYFGTVQATGDRFVDPLYINSTSDWRLSTSSLAVNAGANAANITTRDRIGTTRPIGGAYDLGAYESTSAAAGAVPYFRDFEATGTMPEWSHTTVEATATANFSRFLGRFVNDNVVLRVSTTPNTAYYLIFDFYCIDSWDGNHISHGPDYFGAFVDGNILFRETFSNFITDPAFTSSIQDWPERWSAHLGFNGSFTDSIYRSIAIPFTAEFSTTNLGFFGQNLTGLSDESWGIDNVRVVAAADAQAFLPNFTEQGRLRGYSTAAVTAEASGIFVGDVTGDGVPDVIQGGSTMTSAGVTGSILSASTATPGIFSPVRLPALSIRQAALADFNGDGRLDLFTPTADTTETLLLGSASGMSKAGSLTFTAPTGHDATIATDLNADGLIDIASLATSGNFAGLNTPSVTGVPPVPPLNPVFSLVSTSAILPTDVTNAGNGDFASSGDLNNDGIADFYYHYNGGRLLLSQTDRTYTHTRRIPSVSFADANKVGSVMADYDNDGDLDLLIAQRSGGVLLYRNPGTTGTFTDETINAGLPTTGGTTSADFGDFDNDGDQDLFITAVSGQAAMYANSGAPRYTFSLVTEGVATETRGGDCVFADADNDGDLDLFVGTQATTHASRLFINALNEQDPVAAQRRLMVRVLGRGQGGTNLAGAGVRVELWNAPNTQFLQRRDLGAARGLGGQRPLFAHFGGVTPSTTYTLRVYFVGGVQTFQVMPANATTTIGATTIPGLFTAVEANTGNAIVVVRWREVGADE